MVKSDPQKFPYNFMLFYGFSYMASAVFSAFMPVYLNVKGYNQAAIGTLLSIGPFAMLITQPVWGMLSDRARYKNDILLIITVGTAFSVLLYTLSAQFYFLIAATVVFTAFSSGSVPVSDTITLESLEKTRWSFGPIRMAGTVGYAIMAVIAGLFAQRNINFIFILYAIIVGSSLVFIVRMPKVKGHRGDSKQRVSAMDLFKDRRLLIFLGFNLIISIMICFYSIFFPIYYIQSGADKVLLGWATFIAAISEVPFLLFADRILKKIGTHNALAGSAAASAIRWILLFFITDPYVNLVLQMFHGLIYIVFNYSIVTYINKEAPKELKTTAQTVYTLMAMGIARIVGSIFGGYLSDQFGIRKVFLLNAGITVAAAVLFIVLIFVLDLKKEKGSRVKACNLPQ